MKEQPGLKNFEYSIFPVSRKLASAVDEYGHTGHSPLMHVKIDFKEGLFFLRGDWEYLIQSNKQAEEDWKFLHRQSVQISMSVYPSCIIDLKKFTSEGLILSMDGYLKDGIQSIPCMGMLLFDNLFNGQEQVVNYWHLMFYLYENGSGYSEIKFRLPLCLTTGIPKNN